MTFADVKDTVREQFGRVGWPTFMLDAALASARRDIEKSGNYYWMRDTKAFNTTASTQTYAFASSPISETLFKDVRALHIKESTENLWKPLPVGVMPLEEAFLNYETDEEDMPELAVVDNATLYLFPTPDDTYNMKLYFFAWTENGANTTSDELTNRFPEALIYGALVWGCDQFEKNTQEADRWRALFMAELNKIHLHDFEREQPTKLDLVPMTGPFANRNPLSDTRWV